MIHFPRVVDPGLVCECGRFTATGVTWVEARRQWWAHVNREIAGGVA